MVDNTQDVKMFDEKYVQELRAEAASWRTKYRDMESKVKETEVQMELTKRGVQADPSWVKLEAGKSIGDSVNDFLKQYPNLAPAGTPAPSVATPAGTPTPKPMPPTGPNSNLPMNPLSGRTIEEIKKDPVARTQFREHYRELIRGASRQVER